MHYYIAKACIECYNTVRLRNKSDNQA